LSFCCWKGRDFVMQTLTARYARILIFCFFSTSSHVHVCIQESPAMRSYVSFCIFIDDSIYILHIWKLLSNIWPRWINFRTSHQRIYLIVPHKYTRMCVTSWITNLSIALDLIYVQFMYDSACSTLNHPLIVIWSLTNSAA
jgi:hypothetical protein